MEKIQRISLKEAREKALPILLSGFKTRNKMRSTAEEVFRSPEKITRDRRSSAKPHLSTI